MLLAFMILFAFASIGAQWIGWVGLTQRAAGSAAQRGRASSRNNYDSILVGHTCLTIVDDAPLLAMLRRCPTSHPEGALRRS